MRLTVLGGYAAPTSRGEGCSGYLIQHGGTSIVADLGPGTLGELRRHTDVRQLDGIVISHGHLDHILDLASLCHLLRWSPTPLPRKVGLHLPPGSSPQFDLWDRALHPGGHGSMLHEIFAVSEYNPDLALAVGDLSIRFSPTVHSLPAWAMRFSGEGPAIGYTADTGPSADLDALFAGVDVLVSEATLLEPTGPEASRNHLTADEAGRLAARAAASTLVLSHRFEENDAGEQRSQAAEVFRGRIEMSAPGLSIETGDPGS